MSKKTLWLLAGAVLVVAFALWTYTAPKRTLADIRVAASSGDGERLAELVDFPSVRESIKEQLRASMAESMAKTSRESQDDPFAAAGAAFGMMLANNLMDTFVDAAVSPSGVARMANGARPTMPGSDDPQPPAREDELKAEMGYESMSRYAVRFADPAGEPGNGVTLVLRRSGLTWRLVNVRFEGLGVEPTGP